MTHHTFVKTNINDMMSKHITMLVSNFYLEQVNLIPFNFCLTVFIVYQFNLLFCQLCPLCSVFYQLCSLLKYTFNKNYSFSHLKK